MKKILKFYSPTCGPCRIMSRSLSAIEGVEIQDIDVTDDSNRELIEKWEVRSIPTTIVLDENGNKLKRFMGIFSANMIKEVCG